MSNISKKALQEARKAGESVEQILDESFDKGALNTNIEQKLSDLEQQYEPRLTGIDNKIDDGLNSVNQQLAQTETKKADKNYVDRALENIGDSSPKGVYDSYAELKAVYPSGDSGIYVVIENGKWYYWNGNDWEVGGIYQSTVAKDFPVSNLIKNGDFSEGLTSWSVITADTVVEDDEIQMLGTGTDSPSRVYQSRESVLGRKLYVAGWIKSTSNLVGIGHSSLLLKSHSGSGEYEFLSTVRDNHISPSILDTRISNQDTVYARNFILIDLTDTFGVGNEPSRKEMDELLKRFPNSWFDGATNLYSFKDVVEAIRNDEGEQYFPIKNLMENGDFSDDLLGWNIRLGSANVINDEVRFLGSGTINDRIMQTTTSTTGNKYYASAWVKTSSNLVGIGHSNLLLKAHTGSGEYEFLSVVRNDQINLSLLDTRQGNKNTVQAKYFLKIDLTDTFGKGNEPSKEEMDAMLERFPNNWFDGTADLYNLSEILDKTMDDLDNVKTAIQDLENKGFEARPEKSQVLQEVLEDIENMRNTIKFPENKGLVSIRFDDNDYTCYTEAFPILRDRSLPFTMAAVADKKGAYSYRDKVTDAQMIEMAESGAEIASHSWNHLGLPADAEEIELEVIKSKYDLMDYYNFHVRNFIEPGTYQDLGVKHSEFGDTVLTYYNFYEGYKQYAFTDRPSYERFGVNHQTGDGKTYTEMKSWVDSVRGQPKSIIIMFHSIGDVIGSPVGESGSRGTTTEYFEELCDYLAQLRDAGEIEVVTDSGLMAADLGEPRNFFYNGKWDYLNEDNTPKGFSVSGTPTVSDGTIKLTTNNHVSRFISFHGMRSPVFRMSYEHKTTTSGTSRVMISTLNGKTITHTDVSTSEWKRKEFVFAIPLNNERLNFYLRPSSGSVEMKDVRIERIG